MRATKQLLEIDQENWTRFQEIVRSVLVQSQGGVRLEGKKWEPLTTLEQLTRTIIKLLYESDQLRGVAQQSRAADYAWAVLHELVRQAMPKNEDPYFGGRAGQRCDTKSIRG